MKRKTTRLQDDHAAFNKQCSDFIVFGYESVIAELQGNHDRLWFIEKNKLSICPYVTSGADPKVRWAVFDESTDSGVHTRADTLRGAIDLAIDAMKKAQSV